MQYFCCRIAFSVYNYQEDTKRAVLQQKTSHKNGSGEAPFTQNLKQKHIILHRTGLWLYFFVRKHIELPRILYGIVPNFHRKPWNYYKSWKHPLSLHYINSFFIFLHLVLGNYVSMSIQGNRFWKQNMTKAKTITAS